MSTFDIVLMILIGVSLVVGIIIELWKRQKLKAIDGIGMATIVRGDQEQNRPLRK